MNTLTKILLVLLALFSLFLCGMVAIYIGSASNYKEKYETQRQRWMAQTRKAENATKELAEKTKVFGQAKEELNKKLSQMNIKVSDLQAKLDLANREKAKLQDKTAEWQTLAEKFHSTNDKQAKLLADTMSKLEQLESKQIRQEKDLKETNDVLLQKLAMIATLQAQNKRLIEEKTDLQGKLDKVLNRYGKKAAKPVPVTPDTGFARPKGRISADIALKGRITDVDMKNSLVEISIGSADGVKKQMKLHVTRGNNFVCDMLILDVSPEKAVGILSLVRQQPKVGDLVSTNLTNL